MTKTITVNFFGPIFIAFTVLMMLGVIGFTPAAVGAAILMSQVSFDVTWTR